jgi:hypothetical protein
VGERYAMAKKKLEPRPKKKSAAVNDEETYTAIHHMINEINEAGRNLGPLKRRPPGPFPSPRDIRSFMEAADRMLATIKGRTRLREWWVEARRDEAAMNDLRKFIRLMVALGPDFEV